MCVWLILRLRPCRRPPCQQVTGQLVPGTWYLVPGLVPGTWYLVPGNWYLVPGTRYLVPGTLYLTPAEVSTGDLNDWKDLGLSTWDLNDWKDLGTVIGTNSSQPDGP